ncbi:MAG: twin-arginine translocase subunit TatC [Desulfovibrio sp.]|nr:twin-arginine translocase subunit TatC [Desulfovibrio sp.]
MTPPADQDKRLPAELEEELDRAVNPGLAAALKKSYAGNAGADDNDSDSDRDPDSGSGRDLDSGSDNDNDNDDDDDDDEDREDKEDDNGNKPMTLRDHLVELRSRLFKSFLWLLAGFCLSWPWNEELFALLLAPLAAVMPEGVKFVYLSPPEAFFVYMKVCLTAGFFLTSPMVFYQVWAFIAPGLYKEEKLLVLPAALSSAVFFLSGVLFCRFVVFDAAFRFFMSYNRGPVQAMLGMEETFGFALRFLLAFGVIFELPLFIFFLSRLGLVTADMLRSFRRYAVLAAVIVGAILTPPDAVSQLLMAGPLILLYEIGIVIALLFGKKKAKNAAAPEQDDDDDGDDAADAVAPGTAGVPDPPAEDTAAPGTAGVPDPPAADAAAPGAAGVPDPPAEDAVAGPATANAGETEQSATAVAAADAVAGTDAGASAGARPPD